VLRQCYKLILNNIFGRMLMAQPDVDVRIVSLRELMDLEPRLVFCPRLVEKPDANDEGGIYVVEIRATEKTRNNHLSPSGGAAVLAYGQMRIFDFAQEVRRVGGKPLYKDTDSVIFARPSASAIDPSWLGSDLGLFKDELEDKVKKHKLGRLLGFVAVTQKLYAFRFEAGWRYYKQSGEPLTAEERARFEVIACKGCRIGANLDVVHYDSLRALVTGENVPASGLKWIEAGDATPTSGDELFKEELSVALQSETEFTQEEWQAFGISDLRMHHFIKSGQTHFKPAVAGLDVKKTQMRRSQELEVSWIEGGATLRGVLDKRTPRVDAEGGPQIEVDRGLRFIATDPLGQAVAT
jgi:hypothetical protein